MLGIARERVLAQLHRALHGRGIAAHAVENCVSGEVDQLDFALRTCLGERFGEIDVEQPGVFGLELAFVDVRHRGAIYNDLRLDFIE